MKILVANLGSTSFKYRLFELDGSSERQLARGGIDRIGQPESRCVVEIDSVHEDACPAVHPIPDQVALRADLRAVAALPRPAVDPDRIGGLCRSEDVQAADGEEGGAQHTFDCTPAPALVVVFGPS